MAVRVVAGDEAEQDFAPYLTPTPFLDSDNPEIEVFAAEAAEGGGNPRERAVRLYYAVRDRIRYDPYDITCTAEGFRAGHCLEVGKGFCVTKAALLAAAARALAIPSRLGYGDVRNHLATPKLIELMGSDLFVFHGYTELFLDGAWVKATPAFNLSLCTRFGVRPLEFDGRTDSLFHPYDTAGRKHMEYVAHRGSFADVPFDQIMAAFAQHYGSAMSRGFRPDHGDFAAEAEAQRLTAEADETR
ncbi:MAG: transglutaminase family protein [Alphaproteobacteria bacterium]|jgi:transglutaminase-like putative cysteine protease|nr:transglutaminase family protein [Alphaproteobacteria bacterium]MDP6517113.1 transglutaminase family protein [Alphaproteobacteria bacterium]